MKYKFKICKAVARLNRRLREIRCQWRTALRAPARWRETRVGGVRARQQHLGITWESRGLEREICIVYLNWLSLE